ncbi:MAG: response regulator transcription factor [Mycobacteriales bacterium]
MRVVLADDAALVREGLARILVDQQVDVVASCSDAVALLAAVGEHRPDVAIIDVRMPPTHTTEGLDAARQIRSDHPSIGVLVLSQHIEVANVPELLASGGRAGYLLKDRIGQIGDLLDALTRIAAGGTVVDPEVVLRLLQRRRGESALDGLSARERDVLALMAEGQTNAAIAARLVLSDRTVETHVRSILQRLDIPLAPEHHRRVLAVLAYLRSQPAEGTAGGVSH